MTGDGPKLRIVATRNVRNGEALSSLRYCGTGQLGWRMLAAKSRCFVFFLVGDGEGHEMSAFFLGLISFSHFSHVTFGEIPSFDSITICLMFLEKS